MLQVNVIQDGGMIDITSYTGEFTISDNIQSLGREFSFSFNNNNYNDTYSTWVDLQLGNTIVVYDNGELIYQGQIVNEARNSISSYDYKCVDSAFYLNKNQCVIQFNKIRVEQAIKQLCSRENIPCQVACEIPTIVDKIYNGEVISKIIDDLLKLAEDELQVKFRREYNNGSLYINNFDNLKMIYDKEPIIGDFYQTRSIENLANKVVIISSSEKNTTVQATAQDQTSIDTYGQYTHYEKVNDKKIAQARAIANQKLKELNKINTKCTLTLWGDNYVRSGRILQFNQPNLGLVGEYLVTNCTHTYKGDSHIMKCEVKTSDNLQE